jgi:nucleotide-binding universal stress UspA family protein
MKQRRLCLTPLEQTAALQWYFTAQAFSSEDAPDALPRRGGEEWWHQISSVGDEILSRLADQGANLLVMGGYGHSRMRELIFGGVTRHIARHMTARTLWSH